MKGTIKVKVPCELEVEFGVHEVDEGEELHIEARLPGDKERVDLAEALTHDERAVVFQACWNKVAEVRAMVEREEHDEVS